MTIWTDHTESEALDQEAARAAMILQWVHSCHERFCFTNVPNREQSFDQYCRSQDYRMALSAALSMAQPGRILKLFREIQTASEARLPDLTAMHSPFEEIVGSLSQHELDELLHYVRTWNASARTSEIAQNILNAVLKCHQDKNDTHALVSTTISATNRGGVGLVDVIESLIPYTERHLLRLDKLIQESYIIDTLIEEMDNGLTADREEELI